MKKPRQFLPLLKQMLGFYRYGPLPLLIYTGVCAAVLGIIAATVPVMWMNAHLGATVWSETLVADGFIWWFFLTLVSTPLPFQILGGTMSLEFLFTRAVDRGRWLRTERVAVIIIGLGPLMLNLALLPLEPKLAFEPALPGSPAAVVQEQYRQIFPGSELTPADPSGNAGQLVIRHGTEMFAVWLLWFGMLCIFLVAAYFSLVLTAWQRAGWHHSKSRLRPWLGAVMINGPVLSPIFLVILFAGLQVNIFEQSFLMFAGHPVLMTIALIALILAVQRLSERNIKKLEFEFF